MNGELNWARALEEKSPLRKGILIQCSRAQCDIESTVVKVMKDGFDVFGIQHGNDGFSMLFHAADDPGEFALRMIECLNYIHSQ